MTLSRRQLLTAGGAAAAGLVLAPGLASARPRTLQAVTLTGVAFGTGRYDYLPFEVPAGVSRIDVRIDKTGDAKTGIGLFDARGAHFATLERPNGFRGIYGEERGAFFVSALDASQSFLPGPMDAGTWTVVVPVFLAPVPTPYTVTVTMSAGPSVPFRRPGPEVGVVVDEPGWYRGDLHAHTPESSDAWKSGSAMNPAQWAEECRRIGLDFLALTDHNVISQNFALRRDAGEDVLLMAGEEMTNWAHGHATISGIEPGEWFDWRQRPAGVPLDPDHEGTIQEFLRAVRASGAYVSAAHPLGAHLSWQFFGDAEADPAARTDGMEVWTGQFQPDDEAAVRAWDAMLQQGQRIVANGGSDLHGVRNGGGFVAGTPTTVVHAPRLAKCDVVEALRAGRSFVTRKPDGVELYLAVTGPGAQRQIMGGTVYGAPDDLVDVEVVVRRAAGMTLTLLRDGVVVLRHAVTRDAETVQAQMPVGAGGYVRAEVRSAPEADPASIRAGRLDMEALTNPVWLEVGAPPPGTVPDDTQPPEQPGPRRTTG
jgi:hypothetical protein